MPLTTEKDQPKSTHSLLITTITGMGTGVFCAGLFNFYDRALYLSVYHARPFLTWANFTNPFQCILQTCAQRAITWGSYYVFQSEMKLSLYPLLKEKYLFSENGAEFCVGLSAGSLNGVIANPISAVKYRTWGKEERNFFKSVEQMWKTGGARPFLNGAPATVLRDGIYGSTYECMRHFVTSKITSDAKKNVSTDSTKNNLIKFGSDLLASGTSTIFSSPLNYVRNIQYGTDSEQKALSTPTILKNVFQEAKNKGSTLESLSFLQQRFRIGWGTARVALGMATGQVIYNYSKELLTAKWGK